jgi:hypothetical protein
MKVLTIPMDENTYITEEQEAEFDRIKETTEIIMNGLGDTPQTPERRITKIKTRRIDDAEEITIAYEVEHKKAKNGWFSASFTCKEEARNEFFLLMDQLLPTLIQSVGLDSQWEESGQIIGVSLKHSENGIGITVTGKCKINDAYPCPTSPYVIVHEQIYDLIINLQKEAIKYLDGARRQQALFS